MFSFFESALEEHMKKVFSPVQRMIDQREKECDAQALEQKEEADHKRELQQMHGPQTVAERLQEDPMSIIMGAKASLSFLCFFKCGATRFIFDAGGSRNAIQKREAGPRSCTIQEVRATLHVGNRTTNFKQTARGGGATAVVTVPAKQIVVSLQDQSLQGIAQVVHAGAHDRVSLFIFFILALLLNAQPPPPPPPPPLSHLPLRCSTTVFPSNPRVARQAFGRDFA
jgi:hypothetical protein